MRRLGEREGRTSRIFCYIAYVALEICMHLSWSLFLVEI
jgi:hypothetical protein